MAPCPLRGSARRLRRRLLTNRRQHRRTHQRAKRLPTAVGAAAQVVGRRRGAAVLSPTVTSPQGTGRRGHGEPVPHVDVRDLHRPSLIRLIQIRPIVLLSLPCLLRALCREGLPEHEHLACLYHYRCKKMYLNFGQKLLFCKLRNPNYLS